MRKIYAFFLALLLTLAIANLIYISKPRQSPGREVVIISKVIDGDTIVLDDGRHIRLININSPEKTSPLSIASTNFLKEYEGKQVEIENLGLEKYGRTLARIYSPEYLNIEAVRLGFASKFLVNENEIKEFYSAEEEAISSQKGIWKHSNYSKCFSINVDPKKEIVIIENSCQPINLFGWFIKDESRKTYKFSSIINDRQVLHSAKGNDSGQDIFWQGGNIWDDNRDTAYLFDSENALAAHYSYGY